jgi:hypothetical protein
MSALEKQFTEWAKTALSQAERERLFVQATKEFLTDGEGMVKLKFVGALVGETTLARTLSALADMGVPVRHLPSKQPGKIPRRRYVLRSELDAAMRRLPALPPAVPHPKQRQSNSKQKGDASRC